MKLRTATRSAVVLLTAIGATSVVPTTAPASTSAGSTTHATADRGTSITTAPWSFIRRACRTVTAGTVCVNVEGNSQPSTYRIVYQLQPKAGQWMRPLSSATWFSDSTDQGNGAVTRYRPFCATTCAAVRQSTDYVVASRYYAVYTIIVDTSAGHVDLSAGVTPTTLQGSVGGCGNPVAVRAFLTSTSDGTVYLARAGSTETGKTPFTMEDHTPGTYRVFVNLRTAGQRVPAQTFYAGWIRYPQSNGTWATQHTVAISDTLSSTDQNGSAC